MTTSLVASRRPEIATRAIRLADGNDWGFSLPSSRFMPKFGVDFRSEDLLKIEIVVEHSLEIRRRLDDLFDALESATEQDRFETFLSLASAMLQEGRDVDLETALKLLDVAEHDLPRLILEVVSVALGEEFPAGTNSTESERQ